LPFNVFFLMVYHIFLYFWSVLPEIANCNNFIPDNKIINTNKQKIQTKYFLQLSVPGKQVK